MDSKRKHSISSSTDAEDRAKRRKKVPDIDLANGETPETTTEYGFNFVENLRQARDKRNRLIATHFLTLPDPSRDADYYVAITLPVALDTIEAKLTRREYPNLSSLEADMKRLISNAKSYNNKSSEIFSDAEKVRKMLSDFMRKNNPAYLANPNHITQPTATPDKVAKMEVEGDADGDPNMDGGRGKRRITASRLSGNKSALNGGIALSTPSKAPGKKVSKESPRSMSKTNDFQGKTFQEAQEMIIAEMIDLKDSNDEEVAYPFINLPSRKLVDYYALIKHPVSLRALEKMVRGVLGRGGSTGVSAFKSWKSFEDEVSYIWRNAREYNEDGSEITELAGQLETFFNKRLTDAKNVVPEPAHVNGDGGPRIRLKIPAEPTTPKITLRVGAAQKSASPVKAGSPALRPTVAGAIVDDGASHLPQQNSQAGLDGQGSAKTNGTASRPRNPFGGSQSTSTSAHIPTLGQLAHQRNRSVSSSGASPTPSASVVKSESRADHSPSLGGAVLANGTGDSITLRRDSHPSNNAGTSTNQAASSMPPPSSVTPRPHTDSPAPTGGFPHGLSHHSSAQAHGLDSKWRHPGKDASDALISNLKICTHPGLKLESPFRLDLPPSATSTQQSVTINLPSTHYYLQIVPTIAPTVSNRQSKLFVTFSGMRMNPIPQLPGQADLRRPLYEVKLALGVNRIEVEMIAGPARGAQKVGTGPDVELEKFIVFVNLMKS